MNFSLYTNTCKRKRCEAMKNMKNLNNQRTHETERTLGKRCVFHVFHVIHAAHGFACACAKTHLAEVGAGLMPVDLTANKPGPHLGSSSAAAVTGNSNPECALLHDFSKGAMP